MTIKKEIEVPCNIGDILYCISDFGDDIWRVVCNGYVVKEDKVLVMAVYAMTYEVGVDAFLTIDEAKAAIEKRNEDRL